MREVVWTRAAEADLQAAFDECEERVDGSGGDLLNLVDSAIELLRQFPEMAPFFHAPMRRLLIRTGRHGLFYTVEDRGLLSTPSQTSGETQTICDADSESYLANSVRWSQENHLAFNCTMVAPNPP